ncbi:MAG TPA: hypothetical protein VF398_01370, partial [bacterium]
MSKLDDRNQGWGNPAGSSWWDPQNFLEAAEGLSRRAFMRLAGASMALAGLAGCRRPVEKIVPYLSTPEEVVLGVPNYYATAMPFGLDALGLVVECHEGRPTKIEGNPLHPSTLGGSNTFMQAAILELYDPDRSRQVLHNGAASSWAEFVEFWRGLEADYLSSSGAGLAVLSESFSSPTLARLKGEFHKRFPNAFWATYEPISDENIFAGIRAATSQDLRPVYHFDKADVILSLDADFLGTETGSVRYSRDFASRRKVSSPKDAMNRLYVVESAYSLTGAMADHRFGVRNSRIPEFIGLLAREFSLDGRLPIGEDSLAQFMGVERPHSDLVLEDMPPPDNLWSMPYAWPDKYRKPALQIKEELLACQGKSIIIAGRRQSPAMHALALALNQVLGNVGETITFSPIQDSALSDSLTLDNLAQQIHGGKIFTLIILGGNSVYNAPADLDIAKALEQIKHT